MTILFRNFSLLIFLSAILSGFQNLNARSYNQSPADSSRHFTHARIFSYYQWGRVLQTNDFVRGRNLVNDPIDDYRAVSVHLLKQTYGDKTWEKVYNYPSFGAGVYVVRFPGTPELGKPFAVYGLFTAPFKRWNGLSFDYNLGFGFTMNWESFEVSQNTYNIALGAEQSVYIDFGLEMNYRLHNGLWLGMGGSFTHFSNGALKKPNYGINIAGPRVKLGYDFANQPISPGSSSLPPYTPGNEYLISIFTGTKNVLYDGPGADSAAMFKGVYYPVYGISLGYNRQVSYKSKIGFGIGFDYFGAANSSISLLTGILRIMMLLFLRVLKSVFSHRMSWSSTGCHLFFNRDFISIVRIYEGLTPWTYQRIGIKYHIFKNFFTGLNLHAYHYYISDYIEWNMGYRFGNRL